jgi:succinoglycan biosynthesis protein ExoL
MAVGDKSPDGRRIGQSPLRLAYLVHNLADPAVAKRMRMLTAFGDAVVPVGFHRDDNAVSNVEGVAAIDLGRTFDADFRQRITMVLRQAMNPSAWAPRLADCDVIIARNLEMLLLGAVARRRYAPRASLVYESLDIHRLLLSQSVLGKAMRRLEHALMRRTDLLIVSSPAFLREYFVPTHGLRETETLVVENKLLPISAHGAVAQAAAPALDPALPWHIGWFGMIRCRKSLDHLSGLARRRPDLVRLTIRGRPSYTEFADFDAQVAATDGIFFGGPYRATELSALYGGVHFNWAIDFFEEDANSRWLLPNRIYEGGASGAIPIAIDGTETARWLKEHGIGVVLGSTDDLEGFLTALTPARYAVLKAASVAAPRNTFVADERDCRRLLDALRHAQARRARNEHQASAHGLGLGSPGRAL